MGASGDFNLIIPSTRRRPGRGFPGVIAHGMLTMAVMGRLFSPYFGHGFIQRFQTRFTGMVFVGDVLTVGGRVQGVEASDREQLDSFDVFARNQKGETVASGRGGVPRLPGLIRGFVAGGALRDRDSVIGSVGERII